MEPKEENFNFTKGTLTNCLIKWIEAFAKIPLQHYHAETWPWVVDKLLAVEKFQKDVNDERAAIFMDTKFEVSEGGIYLEYPDEGHTDDASDLFVLEVEPQELYSDTGSNIGFIFCKNNKVIVSFRTFKKEEEQKYQNFFRGLSLSEDDMTWQEAYDALCKIAKSEQNFVPICNL